jgi:DNA-binding NtrC family response regulator
MEVLTPLHHVWCPRLEDEMSLPQIRQYSVEQLIDRNIQNHHRNLAEMVDRFRNTVIVRALALNHGNIVHTANILGISTVKLKNWMDRYGVKA